MMVRLPFAEQIYFGRYPGFEQSAEPPQLPLKVEPRARFLFKEGIRHGVPAAVVGAGAPAPPPVVAGGGVVVVPPPPVVVVTGVVGEP